MRALALAWVLTAASAARAEPAAQGARRIELMPTRLPPGDDDGRKATVPTDDPKTQAIEAAGRARVRDGRVPPAWREAERAIRGAFHPPVAAVATGGAPATLAKQTFLNKPEPPPHQRPASPIREFGALDDAELAQQAARRPRDVLTADVEAELGPDGRLASARVVASSGRARLDEAALAAVRQEVERHPPPVVDDLRVARFRISAARRVTPLDVNPVLSPKSGSLRGLVPKVRFGFDEASGKVRAERPLSQEVYTDVQLISLKPAPAAVPVGRR